MKIGMHSTPCCLRAMFGFMVLSILLLTASLSLATEIKPTHGISMHGLPEHGNNFEHLPYADPDVIKGGTITYGIRGSFDSVNPFILRGQKVAGLRDTFFGNNVYESLMLRSRDEPFTMYGLLAESVYMPEDRSFIEFTMNPKARFSDGNPVTVDDVIFSADLLAQKGRPNYQGYYASIEDIKKTGERKLRITFKKGTDRELPLLISLLPILPKHAIDPETFDQTTLTPLMGSGPYILSDVDQGSSITLTRDPNYWAKDLPVKRGFDNFDEIRFTYYRESNTLFEAFKKGLVDVFFETDPNSWKSNYQSVQDRIVQSTFMTGVSTGMRGYAYNTRRPPLNDVRVRAALSKLFDFEWLNNNLFSGGFTRTSSFFQSSILSSLNVPASKHERELLKDYMDEINLDVLEGTFSQTKTDGTGRDRTVLRDAIKMLSTAGYQLKDRVMIGPDGKPLELELLLPAGGAAGRIAISYSENLRKLGINLTIRQVDAAQFEERRKSFDFDMILWRWSGSLSPGNEQYFRWSSPFAERQGSFNFSGVKSPGVDAMIDAMLAAREKEHFIDAVRALDRLLISGHYVLPHYHLGKQLVAHSTRIGMPARVSVYGTRPETWWIKKASQ
ncbi:MAG: extracellular solute-binding protein [Hyphomicrobiales bacterium]